MKQLDREINGYLKLNTTDLAKQMNNAFEGKKDWQDSLPKKDDAKDKRVKAILAEASKKSELDPILEEGAGG